jgi:glucokinase
MTHPNYALCIDLGGTRVKLGVVNPDDGRTLAGASIPAAAQGGLSATLPGVSAKLRELIASLGPALGECVGVGIALPSLIDAKAQKVRSTNDKYPDAKTFDLSHWSQQEFNLPCVIENDANAALAGEWRFGAGRGVKSVVLMTLGTGIGTSAVIDGQPLRGEHGQAGCLGGHFIVNPFGKRCTCGAIGCLETEASTWALPEIVRSEPGYESSALSHETLIDFAALFQLAGNGDAVARRVRDRCLAWWGAGVVSLIHAYDPERVVMAGGVMASAEAILPAIRASMQQNAWVGWGSVEVVAGELGDGAALAGLAWLTQRHVQQVRDDRDNE